MKDYYTYIITNQKNGTLYIGVTDNIKRRIWEHKQGLCDGFTKKYEIHRLVYIEIYNKPEEAIYREKKTKEVESSVENRAD